MSLPAGNETIKGQQIYTPLSLKIYNWFVLGFSCRFVWRSPKSALLHFYNQHLTSKHMDVGVGTGYFLDNCTFPDSPPKLALLDMNPHCLDYTKALLKRYRPKTFKADIYQPLSMVDEKYDSIGLNYVLHCLPGSFAEKSQVLGNLKNCLSEGGALFGSTILVKDQQHNLLGKKLLSIYNRKGIMSNLDDDRAGLEKALRAHFKHVEIHMLGTVALFVAHD